MKYIIILLSTVYLCYLLVVGITAGRLATDVEHEIRVMKCRAECRLWKSGRRDLPIRCKGYCIKK